MSKDNAAVRLMAYIDREGTLRSQVILPGQRFVRAVEENAQPGTKIEMSLQEMGPTGDFDRQLAILQALDDLDQEGKWSSFVEVTLAIGAELYRRARENKA